MQESPPKDPKLKTAPQGKPPAFEQGYSRPSLKSHGKWRTVTQITSMPMDPG